MREVSSFIAGNTFKFACQPPLDENVDWLQDTHVR